MAKDKLPKEYREQYEEEVKIGLREDTPEQFNDFVRLVNENAKKSRRVRQLKPVAQNTVPQIDTESRKRSIRQMDDPVVFAVNYANVPANTSVRQWLDDQAVSRLSGLVPGATEADIRQALDDERVGRTVRANCFRIGLSGRSNNRGGWRSALARSGGLMLWSRHEQPKGRDQARI